jgi:hypothetical protein
MDSILLSRRCGVGGGDLVADIPEIIAEPAFLLLRCRGSLLTVLDKSYSDAIHYTG